MFLVQFATKQLQNILQSYSMRRMSVRKLSLLHFLQWKCSPGQFMVISHRYPACPHLNNSNFLLLEELSALILRYISFWKTFKPKMSQEGRDLQSHFGMIVLVWRIQLLSAVLCTSSKEPCPSCSAPACLQFLIKKGFTPLPLCPGSPTAHMRNK